MSPRPNLLAADAPSTKQKAPATKSKSSSTGSGRKATSQAPPRPVYVRPQLAPTKERYQQIQEALASKGYLPKTQATGQWTATSIDALKRFQADQNIDATGRINALSLIALGLGPKHEPPSPHRPPP